MPEEESAKVECVTEQPEEKSEQVKDDLSRSASADLPESAKAEELRPSPKDRSNSHCFGSPISALLGKLRRTSSYDVRQKDGERSLHPISTADNSEQGDGFTRVARKSIHGLSSAFATLRGKKRTDEIETVFVFNFVSPTLFLYGKDLQQAATKKLMEWDKIDAIRAKEDKNEPKEVAPTRHFIVDCSAFIFLDNAGAASMVQTYRELDARNIKVYYAAARESVRGFFVDLDEGDRLPLSAFYPTIECAKQVARAFRASPPPHITLTGLPIDEPCEAPASESTQEIESNEDMTFSRH